MSREFGGYPLLSLGVLATMPAFLMDTYLIKNFPVALFWWIFTLALCRLVTTGDADVEGDSGYREEKYA